MKDFDRILFRNEFRTLAGRSFSVIFSLSAILFITVLVLGLVAGSIADLRKRMQNPYTNWINIEANTTVSEQLSDIEDWVDDPEVRSTFGIGYFGKQNIFLQQFRMLDSSQYILFRGLAVEPDEPIVKELKTLSGHPDSLMANSCGIIVTTAMLEELGYTRPFGKIKMLWVRYDRADVSVHILVKVVAIVEELPSRIDFFGTPMLRNMLNTAAEGAGGTSFISTESRNVYSILLPDDLFEEDTKDLWNTMSRLKRPERLDPRHEKIRVQENREYNIVDVVYSLYDSPEFVDFNKFMTEDPYFTNRDIWPWHDIYCNSEFSSLDLVDHLAFHFRNLDRIRDFQDAMKAKFGIAIPMQLIESADNFSMVSALTTLVTFVLFGFALLSAGFYISSVIRSHVHRITPHLGTLKAFGIHDTVLLKTYLRIIGAFCLLSIGIAYSIGILVHLILSQFDLGLKLNIMSPYIFLSLLAITGLCLLLTLRITKSIISHTPGDLIYGRT